MNADVLRFTVSWHAVGPAFGRDGDHLDWFFQASAIPDGPLITFATPVMVRVSYAAECEIDAVVLPEHRSIYLDYDGPVSGDRGIVQRCVSGTFDWTRQHQRRLRIFSIEHLKINAAKRPSTNLFEWVDFCQARVARGNPVEVHVRPAFLPDSRQT